MVAVTSVRVVMYKPVVDEFRGWTGPIGRSTLRLARMIRVKQIALVGKKSGALAASITVGDRKYNARGIDVEIGASAGVLNSRVSKRGYAMANEVGAVPHKIYPRRPGGMLVFYWAKVGHVVRLFSVNHPGNRGYRWAERGMIAGLAVWERTG